MKKLLFAVIVAVSLVVSTVLPPNNAQATTECDRIFYEFNNISIYDPCDSTCTSRDSVTSDRPEILNRDYSGRSILTSAQLSTVREYTPTYQAAAKETQVPWQVIAALHYRESGLKKENPTNGFGIYQDLAKEGGEYPAGTVSNSEFLKQSIWAANHFKSKASKPEQLADGNIKQIKEAFFGYNNTDGRAALYAEQAKSLGYTDAQAYEGSPYVMNKVDGKRDPSALIKIEPGETPTEKKPWGEVMKENGQLIYPAGDEYGAFVVFAALAGIDQSGCTTGLLEGGMDLETAKAFMQLYLNSPDSINYVGGAYTDSTTGPLMNCTAFTNYFINKYTRLRSGPGSGWNITSNFLAANPDVQAGTEPQPYAMFSSRKSANHTGIILGVNEDAGTVIVGDQGYNKPPRLPREMTVAAFNSIYGPMTYAYLADFLKEDL